ncbi:MAG: hypothetical protein EBS70_03260, partial [Actinobacteria bacterium]|nr:hypothetical protein [Actinomycetota bacterium]
MLVECPDDRSELVEFGHSADEQDVRRHWIADLTISGCKVHARQLGSPVVGELTIGVLVEIRTTKRVVNEFWSLGSGNRFANEIVPGVRQLADLGIGVQPLELVQVQTRLFRDDVRREHSTLGVVEQHHARPVLLFVLRLDLTEEFRVFDWSVVVLYAHHREAIIAQRPQVGDVSEHQHVAVHEGRPALVTTEIGRQESGEGEVG